MMWRARITSRTPLRHRRGRSRRAGWGRAAPEANELSPLFCAAAEALFNRAAAPTPVCPFVDDIYTRTLDARVRALENANFSNFRVPQLSGLFLLQPPHILRTSSSPH